MMMNWRGFGRKRSWRKFNVLPGYSPEETERNQKNIKHDSLWTGPRFEPEPPEYEAGVLTTRPRRSVPFSIVIRLWDGRPGFDSRYGKTFVFAASSCWQKVHLSSYRFITTPVLREEEEVEQHNGLWYMSKC
jgi:hypothetical protein